jgi:NadR type nicotinamide-nucleotide adenylyltransferase
METTIKRIVVLGPESTGKSTLCKELANYFQTVWVPEYARTYLLEKENHYTIDDLKKIAIGQLNSQDEIIATTIASTQNKTNEKFHPIFIDTDLYVIKVWSEFVFNSCDNSILTSIATRKYDLYLLCYPDLPWVPDPLREHPDETERLKIYHYYKDAMINQSAPWVEIKGDYQQRVEAAIAGVKKLFQ